MRILHLTDLHLTAPNKTLGEMWAGVKTHLGTKRPDFIVLSGDLSQSATPDQFNAVVQFATEELLPLVGMDRARIVAIPGNHDVSWEAQVHDPSNVREPPVEDRVRYLRDPGTAPEERIRAELDKTTASYKFVHIDRGTYTERRFKNFRDAFYNKFYDAALASPHHPFEFIHEDDLWSAHVFAKKKVAFVGLCSCAHNDRWWTGATLAKSSVRNATRWLESVGVDDEWLKIAVWHHGIVPERKGHADYLAISEIGFLSSNGFGLGFHGHTHKAETRDIDQLFERSFPIIATGSFAVGPDQRPSEHNQCSIVDVDDEEVHWEVLDRSDDTTHWSHGKKRRLVRAGKVRAAPETGDEARASRHWRHVAVGEDGIATISIHITNLAFSGRLVLASVNHVGCGVDAPDSAEVMRNGVATSMTVHSDVQTPHVTTYYVYSPGVVRCDAFGWQYTIANAFALGTRDLEMRSAEINRRGARDNDSWTHTARFRADELMMGLQLPATSVGPSMQAHVARPRFSPTGGLVWEADDQTVQLQRVQLGSTVTLVACFRYGKPGKSYAIEYRPAVSVTRRDAPIVRSRLIRDCLETPPGGEALSDLLTQAMEEGPLRSFFEAPPTHVGWVAHVWDNELRVLRPCFGRFPRRTWASVFRYGEGVVGHAFRQSSVAVYVRGPTQGADSKAASVTYVPRTMAVHSATTSHEWIVCVPLRATRDGKGGLVGTLSFSSRQGDPESHAGSQLEALAHRAAKKVGNGQHGEHDRDREEARQKLAELCGLVSHGLWNALAVYAGANPAYYEARTIRDAEWSSPGAGGPAK